MRFRTKFIINILFVVSILLDLGINYLINIFSQDDFNLFATQNIISGIILILLIIIYIIIQVLLKNDVTKNPKKKLQKVFQDNGGYEAIVDEMKTCIEKHDYKSIKELKKIAEYIEK